MTASTACRAPSRASTAVRNQRSCAASVAVQSIWMPFGSSEPGSSVALAMLERIVAADCAILRFFSSEHEFGLQRPSCVTRLPRSDTLVRMNSFEAGDARAVDQLLPQVYAELRKLAAPQMANEKPGHTLDATALVHEAWLRLGGNHGDKRRGSLEFSNPPHFLAAAAEAMRRILVDHARANKADKRGGGGHRF